MENMMGVRKKKREWVQKRNNKTEYVIRLHATIRWMRNFREGWNTASDHHISGKILLHTRVQMIHGLDNLKIYYICTKLHIYIHRVCAYKNIFHPTLIRVTHSSPVANKTKIFNILAAICIYDANGNSYV